MISILARRARWGRAMRPRTLIDGAWAAVLVWHVITAAALAPDTCDAGVAVSDPSAIWDSPTALIANAGTMYIAGSDFAVDNGEWRLERRATDDCGLQPGFGAGGVVSSNPSATFDGAVALAAAGGAVFVLGLDGTVGGSSGYQWRIEKRSAATGGLMGSFGAGGVVLSDPGPGSDYARAIAADGAALYVAGQTGSGWLLEKRDQASGALIAGFGTAGGVSESSGDVRSVTIVGGAALVLGGTSDFNNWLIERRDPATGAVIYRLTEPFAGVGCGPQGPYALASDGTYLYAAGTAAGQWRVEKRRLADGALIYARGLAGTGDCDRVDAIAIDATAMYLGGTRTAAWRLEKRALLDGGLMAGFGTGGAIAGSSETFGVTGLALDGGALLAVGEEFSFNTASRWRIERRDPVSGDLMGSLPPTATRTASATATVTRTATRTSTPDPFATPAPEPPNAAARRCIGRYNDLLRLAARRRGRVLDDCVDAAGRGFEPDPAACLTSDPGGRIAMKEAQLGALFSGGGCDGSEPIQQGAANGSAAHRQQQIGLVHDLFGSSLVGLEPRDRDGARCQERVARRALELYDAQLDAFGACKRAGLDSGAILDAGSLEAACLTPRIPDSRGRIAARVRRLDSDARLQCGDLGDPLSALFPGSCADAVSADDLAACVQQRVSCRVCTTLNAADGMTRDCDAVDDGELNESCGPVTRTRTCTFASSDSVLELHIVAIPQPISLHLSSGQLRIHARDNRASCELGSVASTYFFPYGYVCMLPGPTCDDGQRFCGSGDGPAVGASVESEGAVAACSSQSDCTATCATFCNGAGVQTAACIGHCSGATERICLTDADCAPGNGICHGPDPVPSEQRDVCRCTCLVEGRYGPSADGDLQCTVGVHLRVEQSPLCDGSRVVIDLGDVCMPLSSGRVTATMHDANGIPCPTPGCQVPLSPDVNDHIGQPVSCQSFDDAAVSDLTLVGAANFFGTWLGDLSAAMTLRCQ